MSSLDRLPRPKGSRSLRSRAATVATGAITALGVTALCRPAHACEPAETMVWTGMLGPRPYQAMPAMPRNAAFLWYGADPPPDPFAIAVEESTRDPIMGRVVRRLAQQSTRLDPAKSSSLFMVKSDELLAASSEVTVSDAGGTQSTYRIGDYVDETPPARPQITGGGIRHTDGASGCGAMSSCGEMTVLDFGIAEPVTDDHAPAEYVAYAVYLERTIEEARSASTPRVLLSSASSLLVHVDRAWLDSDAYLTVSAIDFAGNESPRSEPYLVNATASGCAVASHRRRPLACITAFFTLAALAFARRRRRLSA